MVSEFVKGKYYVCVLKERATNWNYNGDMDKVLDGKPYLCEYADYEGGHKWFVKFVGLPFGSDSHNGAWLWHEDEFKESDLKVKVVPIKVVYPKYLGIIKSCSNLRLLRTDEDLKSMNEDADIYKLVPAFSLKKVTKMVRNKI